MGTWAWHRDRRDDVGLGVLGGDDGGLCNAHWRTSCAPPARSMPCASIYHMLLVPPLGFPLIFQERNGTTSTLGPYGYQLTALETANQGVTPSPSAVTCGELHPELTALPPSGLLSLGQRQPYFSQWWSLTDSQPAGLPPCESFAPSCRVPGRHTPPLSR